MLPTGGESGWLLYKKQKVKEQWPDFFSLRWELPLGHPWASDGLGIRIWQQNEEGLKLDMTSDSRKFAGGALKHQFIYSLIQLIMSYLLARVIVRRQDLAW